MHSTDVIPKQQKSATLTLNGFLQVDPIKTWFERQAFGVCDWWGEKLRIKSSKIRLFFIYTSFLTVGSPVIIYLSMAFVLNLRNLTRKQRGSVWDL